MTRLTLSTCLAILLATPTLQAETPSHRPGKKWWLLSCAALVAVNAMDVHSSRGLGEANPLLRDPSGRFAPQKATLLKGAITGGFLAFQYGLTRTQPQKNHYRAFTLANTVAAGGLGAVAARNYSLPGPRN